MRDITLGGMVYVEPGVMSANSLFTNEITFTEFSISGSPALSADDLLPDNVQLASGSLLIEGSTWAAYHPLDAMQVIGRRGNYIYLFTRAQVYKCEFNYGSARLIFKELCAHAKNSTSVHLTQLRSDVFWSTSPDRLHAEEVLEIKAPPDSLGGMDEVMDLRKCSERTVDYLVPGIRGGRPASFEM